MSTSKSNATIRFVLDGERVEVSDVAPTTTVLEWLREHAGRTGTKEGCAEGDCGACTVAVGAIDKQSGSERMRYRAVNSCIRFLPTLDGKELVTVESLADGDTLHPVQQAMVDCHASQCGFCTPGFVMSLFALYQQQEKYSRSEVVEALAGNLCRCTGYRPIIEAGCAMASYAAPRRWSRAAAQARMDALRALRRASALALPGFHAPRGIDELAAAYANAPDSLLLAGGTDVGLWVTKHLRELPPMIYLGEVAELQRIETRDGALRIGAAVSLTDAWGAIVAAHPALAELAQRFASPPVRNAGTLVGNIANGSPIGDAMPALIALGATVELRRGAATRALPLESLYLDYMKKDIARGEFVVAVRVPTAREKQKVASYKLSKRIDQDISAVCAAFALELDGAHIASVRIAYGGMAAIPARAKRAEAALQGKALDSTNVESACAALAQDFTPLTDLRASADYRIEGARNLLRRFFLELATAQTLRTFEAAASA